MRRVNRIAPEFRMCYSWACRFIESPNTGRQGFDSLHILLAAPVVLFATVMITPYDLPNWLARTVAGVVGTFTIGPVIVAFVFRKVADDDLRNETNRKL